MGVYEESACEKALICLPVPTGPQCVCVSRSLLTVCVWGGPTTSCLAVYEKAHCSIQDTTEAGKCLFCIKKRKCVLVWLNCACLYHYWKRHACVWVGLSCLCLCETVLNACTSRSSLLSVICTGPHCRLSTVGLCFHLGQGVYSIKFLGSMGVSVSRLCTSDFLHFFSFHYLPPRTILKEDMAFV